MDYAADSGAGGHGQPTGWHDAVVPKDRTGAHAGSVHRPAAPPPKCLSVEDQTTHPEIQRGMRITFKASLLQAPSYQDTATSEVVFDREPHAHLLDSPRHAACQATSSSNTMCIHSSDMHSGCCALIPQAPDPMSR